MTTYTKINTLWMRDPENKNRIIEGKFSKPEFPLINNYLFTEKIDGTNIRIIFNEGNVTFGGKTDDSQIPSHLINVLIPMFTEDKFIEAFKEVDEKTGQTTIPLNIILFGEGYGSKIRTQGGIYFEGASFILFDVWVNGWWLERKNVEDIAAKFKIPVVPVYGEGTWQKGVEIVKTAPLSFAANNLRPIEGIVARSEPMVLFRDGTPVMWKLKVKDYNDLKISKGEPK